MVAILNHVSLAAPFRVGAARLESCLILWILNEDSKCSELCIAVRVKHTLQKKMSCLQQVSLFNRVISGSNLGLTRIIIWVSGPSGSVGHPGQWYWPGFNPGLYYTTSLLDTSLGGTKHTHTHAHTHTHTHKLFYEPGTHRPKSYTTQFLSLRLLLWCGLI